MVIDEAFLNKIEKGEEPTIDKVNQLSKQYPYLVWPLLWLLDHTIDAEQQKDLRRRISILVADRNLLGIIIGEDNDEFLSFYPDLNRPEMNTTETIDAFLDQFGRKDLLSDQTVPVAPAIDYAQSFLEGDEQATSTASEQNAEFAVATDEDLEAPPKPKEISHSSTTTLSESLAFAMIKNHNYEKALQIISELSLINPKKSVYFADQIRFLKKLIILESKKNKN